LFDLGIISYEINYRDFAFLLMESWVANDFRDLFTLYLSIPFLSIMIYRNEGIIGILHLIRLK